MQGAIDMEKLTTDELRDQMVLFRNNPIWHMIQGFMQAMYADAAEEALAANDIAKVKWASGVAHAVRMVSDYENNIPALVAVKEPVR